MWVDILFLLFPSVLRSMGYILPNTFLLQLPAHSLCNNKSMEVAVEKNGGGKVGGSGGDIFPHWWLLLLVYSFSFRLLYVNNYLSAVAASIHITPSYLFQCEFLCFVLFDSFLVIPFYSFYSRSVLLKPFIEGHAILGITLSYVKTDCLFLFYDFVTKANFVIIEQKLGKGYYIEN